MKYIALYGAGRTCSAAFSLYRIAQCRADLNKYEAAAGGEFNIGTAQQYGEADIKGKDFHDQVSLHSMLQDSRFHGMPSS